MFESDILARVIPFNDVRRGVAGKKGVGSPGVIGFEWVGLGEILK